MSQVGYLVPLLRRVLGLAAAIRGAQPSRTVLALACDIAGHRDNAPGHPVTMDRERGVQDNQWLGLTYYLVCLLLMVVISMIVKATRGIDCLSTRSCSFAMPGPCCPSAWWRSGRRGPPSDCAPGGPVTTPYVRWSAYLQHRALLCCH